MSFLFSLVKPLAYLSLPVLLLRSFAQTSPVGRYYYKLGLYLGSLVVVSTWGVVIAVGMTLIGRRQDVNFIVARCFYAVASRALDIQIDVEGKEHLQSRPAVLVGNHQSMLDILFLGRIFPHQASIMAKKELQWSPLGPWMFMSGAVFVDRGNGSAARQSLVAAGETMKSQGMSLWMYPEGTRHSQEEPTLLPFKKGAFHLAVQAGIPITPVVCENYWRIYHKGCFESSRLKIRVLPPIPTSGLTMEDVTELAARVRDQMLAALREISIDVSSGVQQDESADQTGTSSDLPAVEQPESGPSTVAEGVSGVADSPIVSEERDEEAKTNTPQFGDARSLRKEGSEHGTETDEDEGMVLVGRPK
ncbi:hypothetical protein SERLA73DRAFT_191660 [Serpula lacrymans var. lacrymans S7.3]|uniref:1-acyl-sn-glycerol-3-phosphate acyltransferase n=2 Tax=Serpula lacrymans var. lacrymans TaxID=341189 RepID=F8QI15_SERL3|nr:uncharacterized protein SERLADRAFT_462327 [Serpula lacrymans var. lacrymans S7.9]EGN92026.1 hypothetical protein SERLA73DRAFT_191660 [Serpula lacrymans var. lacrymans S7.3]EGO27975.1 hypothetical protein SERLADRAFT_462327 [Serpula lacrymans var. lacrymans S7.9]